jgi:hypothetical protein
MSTATPAALPCKRCDKVPSRRPALTSRRARSSCVQENAQLNSLGPLATVESDAFRFLEGATPLSYDVVVVDPPKFARAQKDLPAALKGYQRLNALAMGDGAARRTFGDLLVLSAR